MQATKERILRISEQLFFEQGIANVRLQQIADKSDISVGNLAYHYKNKEAIVEGVYESLFKELSDLLSKFIVFQEMDGFDKQFAALYEFYNHNNFTFNNLWEIERNYPDIQKDWLSAMAKISLQFKKRIEYNIKVGNLQKERKKGDIDLLVQNLSILSHSILPQQLLRGKPISANFYKKSLWAVIVPILSEKGRTIFEQQIEPALNG